MQLYNHSQRLINVLGQHTDFAAIVPLNLHSPELLVFDLSETNPLLQQIDFTDKVSFNQYIFGEMRKAGSRVAIGKYNEDRIIYRQSENFQGAESRSIHLGIDIWAEAGTDVYSPLPGTVHSFGNNTGFGNYGPTIILQHSLHHITFYTLYGHLNTGCLEGMVAGKAINNDEKIGELGEISENGGWPPHLHFQIIADLQSWKGDFPGVAARSQRENYLQLCPDPNLILRIKKLETG